MEEEYCFITLRCIKCEKELCGLARNYIPFDSKEGCTRKVSEETAARFKHYIEEVIPFWNMYDSSYQKRSYIEIINFLFEYIYNAPVGQKLDYFGKVRTSTY